MKKILLVDNDKNVLQSLKRSFRSMRNEWKVVLQDEGKSAYELILSDDSFDIIITDLRMSGLSGIDLLTNVKKDSPDTIRFALTGSSDSALLMKAASVSHRLIFKPCEGDKLVSLVKNSLLLREELQDPEIRKNLCKLGVIPSLPELYKEFYREMQSPDASVARLGRIIEKDIGMTTRVLQLVNSVFFGFRKKVTSPIHAASLIGINGMRDIVLVAGFFNALEKKDFPKRLDIEGIWRHSLITASIAREIAASKGMSPDDIDIAYTGGLLHDLGIIALASTNCKDYEKVIELTYNEGIPLHVAEKRIFDVDHASVGGFMLNLWGLPHSISEIVTFHNSPYPTQSLEVSPLLIVSMADKFALRDSKKRVMNS